MLNLSHPNPSQIGVGISAFPLRAFVSFVVSGFAFPIPAMSRDVGDYGDPRRALPAHDLSATG